MEPMSHDDQHRDYPAGTAVIAADGEHLGTLHRSFPHFVLVRDEGDPHTDLEVPRHALKAYDGERLYLSVNRRALSGVRADEY